MIYGGLRGSIALALALMVNNDMNIDIIIRERFLFFTGGIVLLTILINGSTIKYLIHYLNALKKKKNVLYHHQLPLILILNKFHIKKF